MKLGMAVGQLREQMSSDEFTRWSVYYARIAQQQELTRLQAGGSST